MKAIEIDLDVNRAIELGRADFGETANQILRRLLGIDGETKRDPMTVPRVRSPRSSGAYSTTIGSTVIEANSLKQLLARAILVCETMRPGFIEALAQQPTPKGRYVVAKSAAGLYPRSPQLVEYAEKLGEMWWYDTNVGRSQVAAYLTKFARLLHLPSIPSIHKRAEKTMLTLADLDLA